MSKALLTSPPRLAITIQSILFALSKETNVLALEALMVSATEHNTLPRVLIFAVGDQIARQIDAAVLASIGVCSAAASVPARSASVSWQDHKAIGSRTDKAAKTVFTWISCTAGRTLQIFNHGNWQ